jgi:hypothetical protein
MYIRGTVRFPVENSRTAWETLPGNVDGKKIVRVIIS